MRALILAAALLVTACSNEERRLADRQLRRFDADKVTARFGPRGMYDFMAGINIAVPEGTKVRAIKAGTMERRRVGWPGRLGHLGARTTPGWHKSSRHLRIYRSAWQLDFRPTFRTDSQTGSRIHDFS